MSNNFKLNDYSSASSNQTKNHSENPKRREKKVEQNIGVTQFFPYQIAPISSPGSFVSAASSFASSTNNFESNQFIRPPSPAPSTNSNNPSEIKNKIPRSRRRGNSKNSQNSNQQQDNPPKKQFNKN